ncbi:MAG: YCF48-related protein [Candidatus Kapabacteria bacterium]|nr:YCF48-related protein [Candidatus Kapabacteria bacterium]
MKNFENIFVKSSPAGHFGVSQETNPYLISKKNMISFAFMFLLILTTLNVSVLQSQEIELFSPSEYGIRNLTDIEKSGNTIFICGDGGLLLNVDAATNSVGKIELDIDDEMIIDLAFNSQNQGVAVCTGGIVLYTPDNGQTWSKKKVDTTDFLTSVNYISDGMAIITAMNGTIYKSSNSGIQWERIKLNTDINIRSSAGMNNNIIICGDIGMTGVANVGGNTWSISSRAYMGNILSAASTGNSIVIGTDDGFYYSEDAGNSWVRPIQPEGLRAKLIKTFGTKAYAATDSGKIYVSADEGKSWTLKSSSGMSINGMLILSDVSWLIAGENSQTKITVNDGQSYSDILPNTINNYVSVNHLYDGSGFILSTAGEAKIVITNDMLDLSILPSGFYRKSLAVGNSIYALEETGKIYISSDVGSTWELKTQIPGSQICNDFSFRDDFIFAACTNGEVLKYNNTAWTAMKVQDSLNLTTIRFFDNNNGFVCGSLGKIYFTTNSGSSWAPASTPSTAMITDAVVLNSDVAFACGFKGEFFMTSDKGATWEAASDNSANDNILTLDIHPDMMRGIAGTASGKLLYTDDAFRTWNTIYDYGHLITDVSIYGNNFIAAGQNALVLRGELLPLSVEETNDGSIIMIHPNPGSGRFTLTISNNGQSPLITFNNPVIEITDISGKIVYEKKVPELNDKSASIIDLGNMPSGVYLLNLKSESKTYSKKLIINK